MHCRKAKVLQAKFMLAPINVKEEAVVPSERYKLRAFEKEKGFSEGMPVSQVCILNECDKAGQ
jgi:hypothetical protein